MKLAWRLWSLLLLAIVIAGAFLAPPFSLAKKSKKNVTSHVFFHLKKKNTKETFQSSNKVCWGWNKNYGHLDKWYIKRYQFFPVPAVTFTDVFMWSRLEMFGGFFVFRVIPIWCSLIFSPTASPRVVLLPLSQVQKAHQIPEIPRFYSGGALPILGHGPSSLSFYSLGGNGNDTGLHLLSTWLISPMPARNSVLQGKSSKLLRATFFEQPHLLASEKFQEWWFGEIVANNRWKARDDHSPIGCLWDNSCCTTVCQQLQYSLPPFTSADFSADRPTSTYQVVKSVKSFRGFSHTHHIISSGFIYPSYSFITEW